MTGWLNFEGNLSTSIGFYTTGKYTHNAPERDVTVFQIAGRNGDFFVDNGRYKNIEVTYPCFAMNFSTKEQYIRNMFASARNQYGALTDSYDADHFRWGRLVGGIEFEPVRGDAANFSLTFDCDPRRFRLDGDEWVEFESGSATCENPTFFDSKPMIQISGITEGMEIEVTDGNGKVYTLTATDDFSDDVYIDSEKQDIFAEITDQLGNVTIVNKNDLFDMPDGFPAFTEGQNDVQITGTYGDGQVLPRWWEL